MPTSLAAAAAAAASCTRCSLATGRTNVVFGTGVHPADAGSPLATSPTGTDR